MTRILVIGHLHDGTFDGATLSTVMAAASIGDRIDILCAGSEDQATQAIDGVASVILAAHELYHHQLAEPMAALIHHMAPDYTHILCPATTTGKDIMPRVAALLDTQQISDITEVIDTDTFTRPIYAGNAFETVKSHDAQKVITVRPTAFDKAACVEGTPQIEMIDFVADYHPVEFLSLQGSDSERPDLASAAIVVSGGRGLGSGDNFDLVNKLAEKLGAAVGASRAAVDAGYVPNDYQVGQTGKIVAPDLYIAVGISGAIQHLAGMKESKVIVAINKDENAPIFDVADYGLVADLFDAVPELTDKL